MLQELETVNEDFISLMRAENGVLGAWYFGSVSHGTTDAYSDIDIVFLILEQEFSRIGENIHGWLEKICDEVILCWPEGFNGDAIQNDGYLLKKNGRILQYDVFLLNQAHLEDPICRLHYAGLQKKDVIFDMDSNVDRLIQTAPAGKPWKENVFSLIDTYWYHFHMTAKYLQRRDFFKLDGVLRVLMDTHASLLLTFLDPIPWGGSANKLHFLEEDMQKRLMRYGCTGDFEAVQSNLAQSAGWFDRDVAMLCGPEEAEYNRRISEAVRNGWSENAGMR